MDIADLLIRPHGKEYIEISPVERYEDPGLHPTFLKLKELVGGCNMEELALPVEGLDLGLDLKVEVEGEGEGVPNDPGVPCR